MSYGRDLERGEKTPLLKTDTARLEVTKSGLYAYADHQKVLKYDPSHASSVCALFKLSGTAFASTKLWFHVFGLLCNCVAIFLLVYFLCRRPELIDAKRVSSLVNYFSLFIAVMLAFYMSVVINRWWAMRNSTLGAFWGAVDDLALILGAHYPELDNRPLKTLVLRYCMLSYELIFMQAQGTDGDLSELIERNLLKEEERRRLQPLSSKSQVVWVWIASVFRLLAEQGKLSSRLLVRLYGICATGRSAIGSIFAHVDTQLPYAYVHLLSVLVHLNSILITCKAGTVAAVAVWNLVRSESPGPVSDAENVQVLLLQIFMVIVVPLFFHAFLECAATLSDPFGNGPQDFPRLVYHFFMRDECEAFHTAGEDRPHACLQVVEQVVPGCITHDRITVKGTEPVTLPGADRNRPMSVG